MKIKPFCLFELFTFVEHSEKRLFSFRGSFPTKEPLDSVETKLEFAVIKNCWK
jgi:hypothetical protein